MNRCRVTFQPGNRVTVVAEGTDLLAAAITAGLPIYSSCGGEGVCGRCRVRASGAFTTEPGGQLPEAERAEGFVLACRTVVQGDMAVEVPPESRVEREQILTETAGNGRAVRMFSEAGAVEKDLPVGGRAVFTHSPLATKVFLDMPPPTLEDNVSDLDRLYREVRRNRPIAFMQMGLANVKRLGRLARGSDWRVTATLGKRNGTVEVVLLEPGDTAGRNYGVAVDVGTTTIVTDLVDLNSGAVLGTRATQNRQASYGEDVISRIIYAEKEEGLERLHRSVVEAVNEQIASLVRDAGVDLNDVTCAVCAGNTTMTHLLLRIDPSFMRREPYVPSVTAVPVVRAAEAGIHVNPRGLLSCISGVSAYVGGDISAGVLASGLDEADAPCMLIDIGTNGEIVLGNREWLVCCSSSAGPAFEGGGVTCGMRAMRGAIQRVEIDPDTLDVRVATVGGSPAIGVCGSGYIDCLGEMFGAGIIDKQGKIQGDAPTPRVRRVEDQWAFTLASGAESGTGRDVWITQADIDNLIRSKGAVFAAARMLVAKMGMSFDDVHRIYIGGGFGNYLNVRKSVRIGLLPDVPREKYVFLGNTSLAGARLALMSSEAMRKAQEIAARMTYIELCADAEYPDQFVASLFLPHTDIGLFPSVRAEMETRR